MIKKSCLPAARKGRREAAQSVLCQGTPVIPYFCVAYWKKKYPREVNPTLSMLLSLQYSCV